VSLRTELMGGPSTDIPPYRMLIPPGWDAHDLSADAESAVIAQATGRLAQAGRADLAGPLAANVRGALADLRAQRAFAFAVAGEGAPTWALGAASLVGLKRVGTPELTLDEFVAAVISSHDAAPLGGDPRIVRWAERRTTVLDGERLGTLQLNYIIPIPGSRRTQAVHWIVTAAHDADTAADDPRLVAWEALFDVHVATFSWME
jgi:hypothetical protein